MPTVVRMARPFSFDIDASSRRNIPAGWRGELDDEIARQAIEGGYTAEPTAEDLASSAEPAVSVEMTRAELDALAREIGIDPGAHRTKADLAAAINAARD